MPSFRHNWITNLPNWLNVPAVQELVGKPNLRMVEIGSFEGRGTLWFLDHILTDPTSDITCVDPLQPNPTFNDPVPYAETFLSNIQSYGNRVHVLCGFSKDAWDPLTLIADRDGGYDIIYIDGSHESPDVLHDSVLAWRISKIGTIIVWDDYATPEEKLATDAFLSVMAPYIEVLQVGYQMMVRRIR